MRNRLSLIATTCVLALSIAAPLAAESPPVMPLPAASLEDQFRDPPDSARPRVWWHWMNGNISKDGIAKDLEWMSRVGIGGVQNFDANLATPQVVEQRLVWMSPEWQDALRFAAAEAQRLGLEFAIASSPGWSETGGPWVTPSDAMKKLVWSETLVVGGDGATPFAGTLAEPPRVTGPFQDIPRMDMAARFTGKPGAPQPQDYADVAVLAIPLADAEPLGDSLFYDGAGKAIDGAALLDADSASKIDLPRGSAKAPARVMRVFAAPVTVRSARFFAPSEALPFFGKGSEPLLEASDDGKLWRTVAMLDPGDVPGTYAFDAVTAQYFRVTFAPKSRQASPSRETSPGAAPGQLDGVAARLAQLPVSVATFDLSAEARIDRAEAKAGFEIARDYYALSPAMANDAGVPVDGVLDLTRQLDSDGTLAWTPPAGRWRVLRFGASLTGATNSPASAEATGLEVDKYDGAAVRRYLETYLGKYAGALGAKVADKVAEKGAIDALLTDSIESGPSNWTPRMAEQFRRLRGYDLTPWLPALAGHIVGSREASDRFLYDWRRTLAELLASEHYGTIAKVAHEQGLTLYGEALEDKRPQLGDDMAMRRFADVPMAAMWTHSRAAGPSPTYLADIKGAASVANVWGKRLVAAESLTSSRSFWDHAPASLRHVIDLEFVLGVNRPVIHTSVHQPVDDKVPGLSLAWFGQFFNRHESWAGMARPWVDYLARNSLLLQQGRNVADVAYFTGEEAPLTGLYGDSPVADAPRTHAYDFVDAEAVLGALNNDGGDLVTPGGARYRALYLGGSSRRMTLPVLRRLAELVEGGASLVGAAPQDDPSNSSDAVEWIALAARLWPGGEEAQVGKGRVLAMTDIEAALARIGVAPQFRVTGGLPDTDVLFAQRALADGAGFFVVNRKDRPETIEARFRVTGKAPELWHADSGRIEPASFRIEGGETVAPLALAAGESVHVVFRKDTAETVRDVARPAAKVLASLDGSWSVHFQPERGAPDFAVLPALAGLEKNADPAIRHFSGVATYDKVFRAPADWSPGQPLWLDLGEVREVAEVSVNGKPVGSVWHAPFRLDIGAAVQGGLNRLEVRVANLWVNRLIGDAQPGAKKITWTAMPTYRADAPLRPSGLIGPVTLRNGE